MLRTAGADMVGMSTALEAIAARHLRAEVLAISLITNPAAGLSAAGLNHAEVIAAGAAAAARLGTLLGQILPQVLPESGAADQGRTTADAPGTTAHGTPAVGTSQAGTPAAGRHDGAAG